MFDHVTIRVADRAASEQFYDTVLGTLGLEARRGDEFSEWGDFSVASDHVQVFGWAPLSAAEAREARTQLIAQGWDPIDDADAEGDYITADPSTATTTDDEGYGMTYLFGDGWVTVSDTKQGLLLIEWPPTGR